LPFLSPSVASPLSRFIYDKVIAPAQAERASSIQKDRQAFAIGAMPQPTLSLKDTLGQYPDADDDQLYAAYVARRTRGIAVLMGRVVELRASVVACRLIPADRRLGRQPRRSEESSQGLPGRLGSWSGKEFKRLLAIGRLVTLGKDLLRTAKMTAHRLGPGGISDTGCAPSAAVRRRRCVPGGMAGRNRYLRGGAGGEVRPPHARPAMCYPSAERATVQ
jgi:hypothetical protein